MKTKKGFVALFLTFLATLLFAGSVSAGSVEVWCYFDRSENESEVDVEGYFLPRGVYRARVSSGDSTPVWSRADIRIRQARRARVEFQFESDWQDEPRRHRVTPIPRDFIQGGTVTGEIFSVERGGTLRKIGEYTERCGEGDDY